MKSKKERIQVIGKAERDKLHRKKISEYRDNMPGRAERLCRDYGFTVERLADVFGISWRVLRVWLRRHPELAEAIQRGRDSFDLGIVEGCLIRRVQGYNLVEVTEERVPTGKKITEFDFITGEEIEVSEYAMVPIKRVYKHLPPDVSAIKMWLGCRAPGRWQEKQVIDMNVNTHEDALKELE